MFQEGVLWGALAILSLLSSVATGTPHTWHRNTTLGAAPTAGGMGTASPGAEDSLEALLAKAWSHLSGRCGWGRREEREGMGQEKGQARWGCLGSVLLRPVHTCPCVMPPVPGAESPVGPTCPALLRAWGHQGYREGAGS